MIILGIDPGLNATGYGLVISQGNQLQVLTYGAITTHKNQLIAERLRIIFEAIQQLIGQHQPDVLAIEDIFYHENVRTAIVMGQARGVCMLAAQLANLPIFEYAPREIKMSVTGHGGASKQQIQAMVQRLLHLEKPPRPLDASDALAVAICHHHRARFQAKQRR